MKRTHSQSSSALLLIALLYSAALAQGAAQRPGKPGPRQACDCLEPQTQLELFNTRLETVIVRGTTHVMNLATRQGSISVDAIELRDEGNGVRATGVVLELTASPPADATHPASAAISYIDYDEIDGLITAWDRVAKADETITKLTNFNARYRSKDDLEISVFRQSPGGAIAAAVTGGTCERVRVLLSLEELTRLRWMIVQAKAKLDEVK